jgi:putative sigma-54 modulation protein
MELLVRNADGNVAPGDRDYAAEKLGRLDRYFRKAERVEMVHREQRGQHRLEITVFADGLTLRIEETNSSMRVAIDKAAERMETRLRRLKRRLVKRSHAAGIQELPEALTEPEVEEESDELPLAEVKRFSIKPMSVEEAALQMEFVDHPFFVFFNPESKRTEVLYKRLDGRYGLLSPEA